jgi:hypothetical protein
MGFAMATDAAMRARHELGAAGKCVWCGCNWPCDAKTLADEVERLTLRVEGAAATEALHEAARDRLIDERNLAHAVAESAQAKLRAVETLHVWTNEDGRRFVFADDLAVALRIPGASGPVESPSGWVGA